MKILREVDLSEIDEYLKSLGGGNHKDNMDRMREHKRYFEVALTHDEFKALVFLHTPKLSRLVSLFDRSLKQTAENAIVLLNAGDVEIDSNWNLQHLVDQFEESFHESDLKLSNLLLRDVKPGEKRQENAEWYLQDGCHRALAYMIYLLRENQTYNEQSAFLATNTEF